MRCRDFGETFCRSTRLVGEYFAGRKGKKDSQIRKCKKGKEKCLSGEVVGMMKKKARIRVIENNKPPVPLSPLDVELVAKAQKRVNRLYRHIRKIGCPDPKTGKIVRGWRAVQYTQELSNVRIAWAFVFENEIPSDPETRVKLFMPRVLPSERKHNQKRIIPIIGVGEGWEKVFFKKLINKWRKK